MLKQIASADYRAAVLKKFPMFWWESNQCWGLVCSVDDLQWIQNKYSDRRDDFNILDAKSVRNLNPTAPNFGIRSEHNGDTTLREYLKDVDLSTLTNLKETT